MSFRGITGSYKLTVEERGKKIFECEQTHTNILGLFVYLEGFIEKLKMEEVKDAEKIPDMLPDLFDTRHLIDRLKTQLRKQEVKDLLLKTQFDSESELEEAISDTLADIDSSESCGWDLFIPEESHEEGIMDKEVFDEVEEDCGYTFILHVAGPYRTIHS